MSEEERKAIEYLKFRIKEFEAICETKITTEELEFYKTILNLIKKQQKEIEKKDRAIDKQSKDISNNLLELQKKDKIIDLMAEDLTTSINSKEWIKSYYERKAEEI